MRHTGIAGIRPLRVDHRAEAVVHEVAALGEDDAARLTVDSRDPGLDGDHQRPWKEGEPRQSRLVFIGRELPEATIREGFERCIVT